MFGDNCISERMADDDCVGGGLVGTGERVKGASIRPYIHLFWVEPVGRGVRLDLSRGELPSECHRVALGRPAGWRQSGDGRPPSSPLLRAGRPAIIHFIYQFSGNYWAGLRWGRAVGR
ncbi:MAG: hypothetical protein U0797_23790 [Gemmataceae bacterium]